MENPAPRMLKLEHDLLKKAIAFTSERNKTSSRSSKRKPVPYR
jgi:hypothetical protein